MRMQRTYKVCDFGLSKVLTSARTSFVTGSNPDTNAEGDEAVDSDDGDDDDAEELDT